jgi:hydrogenase-4 membrane subunit HyfE
VWIGGAFAYGVYQALNGKKASIGESLHHGMKHFIPLLFVAILSTLGIAFGFVALIIPGILLMCMWVVAVPACVAERLGAMDSLSRSSKLTSGVRWKVLGLMLIGMILMIAVVVIVAMLLPFSFRPGMTLMHMIIISQIPFFVAIIPGTYFSVMISVIYFELRRIKEGVSADSLTDVFD